MKSFIFATALGLVLLTAPAVAQNSSGTAPGAAPGITPGTGAGTGSESGPATGAGRDGIDDPGTRVRSETERSRSFDRQRGTTPMTNDPRLGPGTGTGSPSGGIGGAGTGSGSSGGGR